MTLTYKLATWRADLIMAREYMADLHSEANAIASAYRNGRVCRQCVRPCECDLMAEGSRDDRAQYAALKHDAAVAKCAELLLSTRIRFAERILGNRSIPSPRLPQINQQQMKEAA